MKNRFQYKRTSTEFLQRKYLTNLLTRFDLQNELIKCLGMTINEAVENFGSLPRVAYKVSREMEYKFSIKEVALYIENALNQIEREDTSNLSIINTVIANNPLRYTMLDNETKECFAEEMEMLPKFYSIEDLEEYVFENLPTDTQINASLYGINVEEQEVIESACNNYGLDYEKYLKKTNTEYTF